MGIGKKDLLCVEQVRTCQTLGEEGSYLERAQAVHILFTVFKARPFRDFFLGWESEKPSPLFIPLSELQKIVKFRATGSTRAESSLVLILFICSAPEWLTENEMGESL